MQMDSSMITEFGNTVIVLSAIFCIWQSLVWGSTGLTNGSAQMVKALKCILVAIGFRIGWWVLALKLAPANVIYHPFFVEWKWTITLPAALLFLYGILLFVDAVEPIPFRRKICITSIGLILAALLVAI